MLLMSTNDDFRRIMPFQYNCKYRVLCLGNYSTYSQHFDIVVPLVFYSEHNRLIFCDFAFLGSDFGLDWYKTIWEIDHRWCKIQMRCWFVSVSQFICCVVEFDIWNSEFPLATVFSRLCIRYWYVCMCVWNLERIRIHLYRDSHICNANTEFVSALQYTETWRGNSIQSSIRRFLHGLLFKLAEFNKIALRFGVLNKYRDFLVKRKWILSLFKMNFRLNISIQQFSHEMLLKSAEFIRIDLRFGVLNKSYNFSMKNK